MIRKMKKKILISLLVSLSFFRSFGTLTMVSAAEESAADFEAVTCYEAADQMEAAETADPDDLPAIEEQTVSEDFTEFDSETADPVISDSVLLVQAAPEDISSYQGGRLSGLNKTAYDQIRSRISAISRGEENTTSFQVQFDISAYAGMQWTAKDLGIPSLVEETEDGLKISEDTHLAMTHLTGYDRKLVILSVIRDCPSELYWFGLGYYLGVPYEVVYSGDEYVVRMVPQTDVILSVSSDYGAKDPDTGAQVRYTVDVTQAERVSRAMDTAAEIIKEATSIESDRDKLKYYYEKILSLSDYDYAAAAGAPYGAPWQIVNVFDNDPDTKVVCEGFAKAFQYLCDNTEFKSKEVRCLSAVGIQTWEGTGSMPSSTHMWNVVHLEDGQNYLVDLTNGSMGGQKYLFLASCDKGNLEEGYYIYAETLTGKAIRYLYIYDADTRLLYPDSDLRLAGNETPSEAAPEVTPTPQVTPTVTVTPVPSPSATVTPVPVNAGVVSGFSAGNQTGGIRLKWKAVPGAKGYRIERDKKRIATIKKGNTAVYLDKKASVNGRTYTYTVRAYFADGSLSKPAEVKSIRLNTPALSSLKRAGSRKIQVKWGKNQKASGYQIQYSTNKSFTGCKTVRISDKKTASMVLKKLAKGKRYYIRIRAYKKSGKLTCYSAWSPAKNIKAS